MKLIKTLFILCVLIFVISNISAGDYIFAEIEINDNGIVNIQGDSDVDPNIQGIEFSEGYISGTTQLLTEKTNGVWKFFMEIDETYSEIYLKIYFPDNTESIQNIITNLDAQLNIEGQIYLEIIEEDMPIDFSVEYSINKSKGNSWLFIFILVIIIFGLLYYMKLKKKPNKFDIISGLLNEKENEIVNLLMKKSMRQKEIRKKLDIPKASFSRYIINLEKKKIISREGEGRNKIVKLK